MISWVVDGAPGRNFQYLFNNITANIRGRIYSITCGWLISVEFNGRSARSVVSVGANATPAELSVHFPVVGDISLAESVHEILGADSCRNFGTQYIKRLRSISGPGIREIVPADTRLTFTFEPIYGTTIVGDGLALFMIRARDKSVQVRIGGNVFDFARFTDAAIHWLRPYVIGGVSLYDVSDNPDTKMLEHAVMLLTLHFRVLTPDDE